MTYLPRRLVLATLACVLFAAPVACSSSDGADSPADVADAGDVDAADATADVVADADPAEDVGGEDTVADSSPEDAVADVLPADVADADADGAVDADPDGDASVDTDLDAAVDVSPDAAVDAESDTLTDVEVDTAADVVMDIDAVDDSGTADTADTDTADTDTADTVTADTDAAEDADRGDVAMDAEVDVDAPTDADASMDVGSSPWPRTGFGTLDGECDALGSLTAEELTTPAIFVNRLDFGGDPFDDPEDLGLLTEGGQEIIMDGNAGGSSLYSEVFAYETLYRCTDAVLLKTETEITYTDPMGRITDFLVEMDGVQIGVSVTRAIAFPFDEPYPAENGRALLVDKLSDILESDANVTGDDVWINQILHVVAYSPEHAMVIEDLFYGDDAELQRLIADTQVILVVTATDGADAPLY